MNHEQAHGEITDNETEFILDTSSAIADVDIPERYRDRVEGLLKMTPVSKDRQIYLVRYFAQYFKDLANVEAEARSIIVADRDDVEGMTRARELRLFLRKKRIAADKLRKALKEEFLNGGRFVDNTAKLITEPCSELEDHLQKQEDFRANLIKAEMERVRKERSELLAPFVEDVRVYDLAGMSEEQFEMTLIGARSTHEQKLAFFAEQKKREEEAEAIRLELANRINVLSALGMQYRNDRYVYHYKEDTVSIPRSEIEEMSPDAFLQAVEGVELAISDLKQIEANDRAADEEAERQRQAKEAELRKENERLQAEAKAKADAERAAEEAEQKRQADLLAAGDKARFTQLAVDLEAFTNRLPKCSSPQGRQFIDLLRRGLEKNVDAIRGMAATFDA